MDQNKKKVRPISILLWKIWDVILDIQKIQFPINIEHGRKWLVFVKYYKVMVENSFINRFFIENPLKNCAEHGI